MAATRRARNSEASTGITVTESTSAAVRADMNVNAIGLNIFPSTPSRLRIGMKTMITIRPANRIGVPTSKADSLNTSLGTFPFPPWACCQREAERTAFSTITTAPSTITPKSTAPKLIRLADTPA